MMIAPIWLFNEEEVIVTLHLQFECPQCKKTLPLKLQDYALGRRQICKTCQIPTYMTKTGLEKLSRDLQQLYLE